MAATLRSQAVVKPCASLDASTRRRLAHPLRATSCSPMTSCSSSISRGQRRQEGMRRGRMAVCKSLARPSVFLFGFGQDDEDDYDEVYTVLKLQVGIFGDIAKWQRDLERASQLYDTDEEGGLHSILQETLRMILRNSAYCSYCTSGGKIFNDPADAEAKFNEVSFEERAKFKEETFTNVDGRTARGISSSRVSAATKDFDQWMCLTLILAVEREIKFPKLRTVLDLEKACKVLSGVTVDELVAFELLWTPQDTGDSYTKDELLTDYPTLLPL